VNHTRFPKEDHLPDCASWDNQVKKGDHVECELRICHTGGQRCYMNYSQAVRKRKGYSYQNVCELSVIQVASIVTWTTAKQ
jgi:hypothetical protein